MIRKTYHRLASVENTTTNIRYSMIPSHNIQQNAARNKYCSIAATAAHAAYTVREE